MPYYKSHDIMLYVTDVTFYNLIHFSYIYIYGKLGNKSGYPFRYVTIDGLETAFSLSGDI